MGTTGLDIAYYYIDSVVVRRVDRINLDYTNQHLCINDSMSVPFTITGPTSFFAASNIFTLQLSNASGSFSSPVDLGTLAATSAGTITGTIPAGTPSGAGYRIRIISSSGADTSSDNGYNITVYPYPHVSVTTNSPLCEGSSTLNLTATGSSTAAYEWVGPDNFYSTLQSHNITPVEPAQSGDYIVSATENFCTSYDTVSVEIRPDPAVSITNNNIVCPGTTFQLSATALPGSTFSWTGPAPFTSNIANPSWVNAAYSDAGLYAVTATLNGCVSTDDINMIVQITTATPVASSNSPVCEDFALNLSATCATPGVSYHWEGPTGFNNITQNPTISNTLTANAGDYVVKATVNGCVSLPDTVNVQVHPKPYLGNYASPNDTVCEGTVVTFVTVPMSGVINPTFQWFKNNAPVPGATNLTLIAPYATGDSFYCRTYCQNQCGDNLTLYSNKVGMMVMPVIYDVDVTITSVPAVPLPGTPITFTAHVDGGGYNPFYQWKKNGVVLWRANSAIYNANNLAPYDEISVCVVSNDPCAATKDTVCSGATVINFPTGIGELTDDNTFVLYPNPNDGSFKVKIQKSKVKSIEVVNVSGQVVYETKPATQQAEYTINLPQQLPSGTYMLRVYDGERYYRKSFTLAK